MKRTALVLLLTLFAAACGTATPTPALESSPSATVETRIPSETPLPRTSTPSATAVIVEGETTTLVNVRSGPGTTYGSLGLLQEGQKVQVDLQSEDGLWLRILYPDAPDGFGWVAAAYVSLPTGSHVPLDVTPTPGGLSGRVLIRLNVRQGPATTFEALGTLEPDTLVVLTAKNSTASWFQIEYPTGSEGRGWVTAQYVQTSYASELPVVDEYGQSVSTGTPGPSPVPVTPTPTLGPAAEDDDSSSSPAVSILFSSSGTRRFTYSSQVSNPGGDGEDWLEFTPFASLPGEKARLLASLSCTGNGALRVEMWQAGALLAGWGTLACGDSGQTISLAAGSVYQFRLVAAPGDGLRFVQYSLSVENLP